MVPAAPADSAQSLNIARHLPSYAVTSVSLADFAIKEIPDFLTASPPQLKIIDFGCCACDPSHLPVPFAWITL